MIKIVIADDNPLICKSIAKILPWDELGAVLAGEAANGAEVLAIMALERVDIVITDIRMPHTDGLMLMNSLQSDYPETYIIVVSAYSDFDYAQKAMKNGCRDYILKPIRPKELIASVERAVAFLHSRFLSVSQTGLCDSLNRFVQTRCTGRLLENKFPHILAIIKCAEKPRPIVAEKAYDWVEIAVAWDDNGYFMLFVCQDGTHNLEDLARLETEKLVKHLPYRSVSGLSGVAPLCDIKQSYCQAVLAASSAMLARSEAPYLYEQVAIETTVADLDEQKIRFLVTSGDSKGMLVKVGDWMEQCAESCVKNPEMFRAALLRLCYLLLKLDLPVSESIYKSVVKLSDMEGFVSYVSYAALKAHIFSLCRDACLVNGGCAGDRAELVVRVLEFVQQNFTDSISLNQVADAFHINLSHLSRIFKEQTNDTVGNYITTLRIEKAKQLLRHTQMKVVMVAEEVGYTDLSYFLKVFKRVAAMTPKAYRQQHQNDTAK